MSERIIVDLRHALRDFVRDLGTGIKLPDYVLSDVVNMVFDVIIFELEDAHDEPDLSKLGNFYRDHLEPDPRFLQRFLESFFLLVKNIAGQLRAHDLYTGDGFEYAPETNTNNRSIVVKRFENPIK
uniref:Uncharacterized protein n=1 Tax=Burkholderia phage vB_BgluM-SURPRISE13 TaxID=3159457 RepID=A0AAU7PFV8_9VIRU